MILDHHSYIISWNWGPIHSNVRARLPKTALGSPSQGFPSKVHKALQIPKTSSQTTAQVLTEKLHFNTQKGKVRPFPGAVGVNLGASAALNPKRE